MGHGTHYYGNITRQKIDPILGELQSNGATIAGDNPWDVDTHRSGVKLRGEWTETTLNLAVTVTDSDWYVPSSQIWGTLDALMHHIGEMSDTQIAVVRAQGVGRTES